LKKIKRYLALSIFLAALIFPSAALASDIVVEADATQVHVGDTVTVTITVQDFHMAIAQGSFKYDYAVLSYVSSTGGASDGGLEMVSLQSGGTSSLTAVIEFTAIGAGDSAIDVSIDSILNYDGESLDPSQGSVNVSVLSNGAVPSNNGSETEVIPPFTLDGIAASGVYGTDAELYVWRSVLNLTLPSGFADTSVIYNGQEIGGAISTGEDGTILLYLSDALGENAGFYVFETASSTLHPYVSVRSVAKTFTCLWSDASVVPPAGYVETTLTLDESTIPAWIKDGSDGSVYLVYVINESGERAFYQYMPKDESLQRFIAPVEEETIINTESGGVDQNVFLAVCVMCGLLLVSVIIALILYLSGQKEKRDIIAFSKNKINALQNNRDNPDEF